jgi:hypothetical protein
MLSKTLYHWANPVYSFLIQMSKVSAQFGKATTTQCPSSQPQTPSPSSQSLTIVFHHPQVLHPRAALGSALQPCHPGSFLGLRVPVAQLHSG